jgi:hypothetical protein
MAPTTPNTVEGGNEALNSALVIAQQVSLLLPIVGGLASIVIPLIKSLSRGRGDQATVEQARAAIEELREKAMAISATADEWLATHPPVPDNE